MKSIFLLMAQYEGKATIPLDRVCADYFPALSYHTFLRKLSLFEIPIPITRLDKSQKGARGIHVADLALYIDERRAAARKEMDQIRGVPLVE